MQTIIRGVVTTSKSLMSLIAICFWKIIKNIVLYNVIALSKIVLVQNVLLDPRLAIKKKLLKSSRSRFHIWERYFL